MFRSEDVSMVRLYISPDIIRSVLEEIGQRDILHLVAPPGKKEGKTDHCAEMEKILARVEFLSEELKRNSISQVRGSNISPLKMSIENLSACIEKHYYRSVQLAQIKKSTGLAVEKMEEDIIVLQDLERISTEGFKDLEFDSDKSLKMGLEYVAGVISKEQILTLEKFLWKSLHGNLCFVSVEMATPEKMGFICFTHGEKAIERIKNICMKIDARIVRYADKKTERKENDLLNVSSSLAQLKKMHQINIETFSTEMKTVSRELSAWKYYIIREIEIEIAREKFEVNKKNSYLMGEGFILKKNEERFGMLVKKIGELHGDIAAEIIAISEDTIRPTHFETTKITECFQNLTNVYGIPMYKEINPTIFSITTFPFLFGCMFGDVGHGLILVAIGAYLIRKEKTANFTDIFEMLFQARYLMVFMGVWSVYFGFLYADFMGYPFGEFISAYAKTGEKTGNCAFGIDYAWHAAENGQSFTNSLKMKSSIILGFAHLTLGMVLNAINEVYRKNKLKLFGVIIPQMTVFFGLIGYVAFLIVLKWCTPAPNWPGVIAVVIEMVSFSAPEVQVYPGQHFVQMVIMTAVLVSLPCLLMAEPIYMIATKNMPKNTSKTDLWLHSMIEGIEFIMGLISNISSYLRLWAVSLAHSELSGILFTQTIGNAGLHIVFRCLLSILWAAGTFILLICLEGLSATLHSLRLHWVEFGSKFFKGEGVLFSPFTFKPAILLDAERKPGGATE
ncbi:V-type H+-transporting ATPase subunit a [Nematocida major]|uniref:V-type H+-transporting ATPase subunit a n=1 Tax=Nematocida major TaxID=1912982 RepID=UPI002007A5BA|nr:V-type H+-transporting ATPase subunit a [Nematocida major]KAH9385127.1 V-type H+-transporting ATPase subunit a [Nematocida major]